MSSRTSGSSDLIIGMTLAELFLLLLFVVWYGFSATINSDPLARLKERVAALEKENARLNDDLTASKNRVVDLEWRLDFLHKYLHLPNDFNERKENAGQTVTTACKEFCRSSPACDREDNVLIEASVLNGQVSMKVLSYSQGFAAWILHLGRQYPAVGVPITDDRAIHRFFDDVRSYYSSTKVEGKECRYDYRLRWASNDDYHDGRERFERYFYPAGNTRVSEK